MVRNRIIVVIASILHATSMQKNIFGVFLPIAVQPGRKSTEFRPVLPRSRRRIHPDTDGKERKHVLMALVIFDQCWSILSILARVPA